MNTRVAIVTGASRGIGRATAVRLARDFGAVVLVARAQASLEEVATEVEAVGADAHPIVTDLRDPEAAQAVVSETITRFGRIDALVNIAGAVPQADLFAMTDVEWTDGLSLKFHGMRRLTLAAWDALRDSSGSVVITSGTSAIAPKAAFAAVGVINAAILALAKTFAERGLADGIQVNSVSPGPVLTDRRSAMLQIYADNHGLPLDEATKQFAAESGIARFGQPEDIAEGIAFLVWPQARWIIGTTLRIDGGETKSI